MNTAQFWATSFIKELISTSKIPDQSNPTPTLNIDRTVSRFQQSKKRIFFLDYDVRPVFDARIVVNS
jgi:trehalose 6-phosphate synthase/phosphatase